MKFIPILKLYECPLNFVYRSDCKANEKTLPSQKLNLNLEVLKQRIGQWNLQINEPVPAIYHLIVVRGWGKKHYDYSVSLEAGLPDSPMPLANGRVEFSDDTLPRNFGVSSAALEKNGKKYLAEIRVTDFHGKLPSLKVKK